MYASVRAIIAFNITASELLSYKVVLRFPGACAAI